MIRYSWSELSKLFGVESPEDYADKIYIGIVDSVGGPWVREEAIRQLGDNAPEDSIQDKCTELESEVIDQECSNYNDRYCDAIRTVAEKIFAEHNLSLTESEDNGSSSQKYFIVEPIRGRTTGWYRAASQIIDTINGVGMFRFNTVREFLESSSCETLEKAVESHLHWIPSWTQVFGEGRVRDMIMRKLR